MQKTVKDIWDKLPDLEHTRKYYDEKSGLNIYEVCGKKFQETAKIEYVIPILENFKTQYGQRAILAQQNLMLDWKAVSHAIRVAYEMIELYEDGTITFPLKEREYIKKVKHGEYDYLTEVAPKMEELMDRVEHLSAISNYPEKVDRQFWDDWLIDTVQRYVF